MPIRLSSIRPENRMIKISELNLHWIGILLLCLSTLSTAVIQRGMLRLDSASPAEMEQIMASGATAQWAVQAMLLSLSATLALPLYAKLLVEAVNHHNPAGLFACRCPRPLGQNGPVLPGQVPAGEPGIALSGQKLPYQLGFAIAGGPVKIDGLGHPAGRLELAQRCRRSNITFLQACLPPFG